jgi:hypothetical protein
MGGRIRYPAVFSNYNLALSWKERIEVAIHEALLAVQPRKQTPRERKKEKRTGKNLTKLQERADDGDPHAMERLARLSDPPKPRPVSEIEILAVL